MMRKLLDALSLVAACGLVVIGAFMLFNSEQDRLVALAVIVWGIVGVLWFFFDRWWKSSDP